MSTETGRYPSLEGRHVLVTGGASGIGAAIVRGFAAQGARTHFLDVDVESGEALAADTGARFTRCDVTDVPALKATIAAAADGGFDVLVNNAARDDRHAFADLTEETWHGALATNLTHHVFAAQTVAGAMAAKGSGAIVNMGSVSWLRGRPGMIGYTASKAAISGITRTLARELGESGIRVNAVIPGAIRTERQARLWADPDKEREFLHLQALKIRLRPQEVVPLVLFLSSDAARGCTGQEFIVDAGLTLN
jgi:NAD(P)-dependent dehydrogenase (short-subunit alcohol dehydrogenase family)